MNRRAAQDDSTSRSRGSCAASADKQSSRRGLDNADGILRDKALVERCLAGEVGAWEELYAQCHDQMIRSVEIMLGPRAGDVDLVDEMAARVWHALVADDGQLLSRYEIDRGARLITFMRALAKDTISRHFRSERRRLQREREVLLERANYHTADHCEPITSLTEFLDTLTQAERTFCGEHLLTQTSAAAAAQAPLNSGGNNSRQLAFRIRKKLLKFVSDNR